MLGRLSDGLAPVNDGAARDATVIPAALMKARRDIGHIVNPLSGICN